MTREEAEALVFDTLGEAIANGPRCDRVQAAEVLADYLARTHPAPAADLGGQRAVRIGMSGTVVSEDGEVVGIRRPGSLERSKRRERRRQAAEKYLEMAHALDPRIRYLISEAIAAAIGAE